MGPRRVAAGRFDVAPAESCRLAPVVARERRDRRASIGSTGAARRARLGGVRGFCWNLRRRARLVALATRGGATGRATNHTWSGPGGFRECERVTTEFGGVNRATGFAGASAPTRVATNREVTRGVLASVDTSARTIVAAADRKGTMSTHEEACEPIVIDESEDQEPSPAEDVAMAEAANDDEATIAITTDAAVENFDDIDGDTAVRPRARTRPIRDAISPPRAPDRPLPSAPRLVRDLVHPSHPRSLPLPLRRAKNRTTRTKAKATRRS